ncbi:MAG TPA: hypothetical protein VGX03_15060 [Candidatus Binatia bacterium]|jgi:hypothetical protein|nr:hypothetical protein [Candidatus Binatia bacterium]
MSRQPSLGKLHRENINRFDELSAEIRTHITDDNRRFDTLDETLKEIGKDVKSLLATRSFSKGIWWAVSTIAGGIAVVASIVVGWVRG